MDEKPEGFLKTVCFMAYTAFSSKKAMMEELKATGMQVVELFPHGQHPVRILQGLFYPERLNRRDKRVVLTKSS